MPTISKDELIAVLQELDDAEDTVQKRQTDLKTAQDRANATSGLTEAAQHEFDNADAKFRVAFEEKADASAKADPTEEEIEAANSELLQEEKIRGLHSHLGKFVEAAGQYNAKIGNTAEWLQEVADKLYPAGDPAPEGDPEPEGKKARYYPKPTEVRTEADEMRTKSHDLEGTLSELETSLQKAQDAFGKVPDLPDLTALRVLMNKLMQSGGDEAEAGEKAKELAALEAARDEARRALRRAPDAERAAQEDLTAKQASLDIAKRLRDDAKAARDDAEQEIIERIVAREEEEGKVGLELIFVDDDFSLVKNGVKVKWEAEAGKLTDSGGKTATLNTSGLSRGIYNVEAHLERVKAGPKKSAEADLEKAGVT